MYNETIRNRIKALREAMKIEGIDYYLVVTDDFHSSEYVCEYFKCREYLSGFSGSNGDLLVWADGAALWTDGRYFLQAEEELSGTGIELMKMGEKNVPSIKEFLEKNMLPGQMLGFDGRTIKIRLANLYEEAIRNVEKKACLDAENPSTSSIKWDADLTSRIWSDRPKLPQNKAFLISEELTGESRSFRLERLRLEMDAKNADVTLISSLDDIAWLLLLRGNDIEYNPVVLAYLAVYKDNAILYVDADKFSEETTAKLKADGVEIRPYENIVMDLGKIKGLSVLYDEGRTTYALLKALEGHVKLINCQLPTVMMKAVKTEREIKNEREAHVKDAVAVTKLLYRLSLLREDEAFLSGNKKLTELDIARWQLELRNTQVGFIEESFAPIVATGAHGAIIHYEPTISSNKEIEKNTFLLMDTGAQYMQGTTDITRCVCMGEPTDEMKRDYTAVLKGHLALMDAVFPEGTTGPNLDILARKPLWDIGLDFRHGTGHGVGFLLNVHEGPQNINQRGVLGKLGAAFVPGMITSDEPGVYKAGKYGIRIENMLVCEKAYSSEYGDFYRFSPLTLVPYDLKSIDVSSFTEKEKAIFNAYNMLVRNSIAQYLEEPEKEWLLEQTSQI